MIQSANVVTRSKPTGSTHATTENAPIMASGAAVSPASGAGAPPQTISSGPSTPLACTTRAQYLGLGFSKQIPRLRILPPETPNALPAGDISNILQKPSSDSDVVIPNNWPRSSTLRGSGGKYPNHRSTPPPTSSSTSIPKTAGPFPAQRTISKNPKIAVIQLQITICLPQTGEVITGRTAKPLAVLRP